MTFDDVLSTLLLPLLPRSEEERAFVTAIQATAPLRTLQREPERWRKLWEENHQGALRGAKLP